MIECQTVSLKCLYRKRTDQGYGQGAPKGQAQGRPQGAQRQEIEIPVVINGEEIRTGNLGKCVMPHNHGHVLGRYHKAGKEEVEAAIEGALKVRKEWAALPWEERAGIFMKAAEILAHEKRYLLNAATMLGIGKTPIQAEIDSACELIDFWRFNVHYMEEIYRQQPRSTPLSWNRVEHRGLEGFIFAVTPFNFAAIAGNLPTAPAMMGNVVIWKPASSAVYPAYFILKILEEAGPRRSHQLCPRLRQCCGRSCNGTSSPGNSFHSSTLSSRICGKQWAITFRTT